LYDVAQEITALDFYSAALRPTARGGEIMDKVIRNKVKSEMFLKRLVLPIEPGEEVNDSFSPCRKVSARGVGLFRWAAPGRGCFIGADPMKVAW